MAKPPTFHAYKTFVRTDEWNRCMHNLIEKHQRARKLRILRQWEASLSCTAIQTWYYVPHVPFWNTRNIAIAVSYLVMGMLTVCWLNMLGSEPIINIEEPPINDEDLCPLYRQEYHACNREVHGLRMHLKVARQWSVIQLARLLWNIFLELWHGTPTINIEEDIQDQASCALYKQEFHACNREVYGLKMDLEKARRCSVIWQARSLVDGVINMFISLCCDLLVM